MIAVPDLLQAVKTAFDGRDIRAERFGRYIVGSWMKHFQYDEGFRAYIERNPEPICRQDFADLGEAGIGQAARVKQLFLATMLWGYGTVGYGAYRTRQMLETAGALEQMSSAYDLVAGGEVAAAYRALRLYKCGPAFMSKFLYATGLCTRAKPLPLILDSIVAGSLRRLLDAEGKDCASFVRMARGSGMVMYYPDGYERYVLLLNAWADQLGVLPDEIELYLFENRG